MIADYLLLNLVVLSRVVHEHEIGVPLYIASISLVYINCFQLVPPGIQWLLRTLSKYLI